MLSSALVGKTYKLLVSSLHSRSQIEVAQVIRFRDQVSLDGVIVGIQGEARASDPSPSPQDELIQLLLLRFGGDFDHNYVGSSKVHSFAHLFMASTPFSDCRLSILFLWNVVSWM